ARNMDWNALLPHGKPAGSRTLSPAFVVAVASIAVTLTCSSALAADPSTEKGGAESDAKVAERLDAMKTVIIAHRGASKDAPENTRSALDEAFRQGAPVIEFDVRETKDGVLVLFHDDKLDRVAGRSGSIEE